MQNINTNISSLNARKGLNKSQEAVQKTLQRLSTGLKINMAKDNAAGFAISERMSSQLLGFNQAIRNANDGVSLAQVAEGGIESSTENLQRLRELAIQSANGTLSASDRRAINSEANQLLSEIARVSDTTEFNGQNLFDGSFNSIDFQVGANAGEKISVSLGELNLQTLGGFTLQNANQTANQGTSSATVAVNASAAALTPTSTNTVSAQEITLSGNNFSDTVVSINAGASANDVASAINANQAATGVSATAETQATLSSLSLDGTVTLDLGTDASGSTSTVTANVTTDNLDNLVDAINSNASATGITAALAQDQNGNTDASRIVLTEATGRNIYVAFSSSNDLATINVSGADGNAETLAVDSDGALAGDIDPNATIVTGSVSLAGNTPFSAASSVDATSGSVLNASSGIESAAVKNQLADVDLSSQRGAVQAISVIDAALERLTSTRANIGVIQNRFESVIDNLSNRSVQVEASRSRIRDADFATEVAELAKAQILQQAGLSVLAQANAIPQSALSLLQ